MRAIQPRHGGRLLHQSTDMTDTVKFTSDRSDIFFRHLKREVGTCLATRRNGRFDDGRPLLRRQYPCGTSPVSTVCHVHYVAITRMIQRLAVQYGMPCNVTALPGMIRSHIRFLKWMGRDTPPTAHATAPKT